MDMINLPDDEVIRYLTADRRAMMEARDLVSGLVERLVMVIYGKYRSLTVTDVNNEMSGL